MLRSVDNPSVDTEARTQNDQVLLARAEQVVELAKKAGADARVLIEEQREVNFEYRDGKMDRVEDNSGRGLTLWAFVDGRFGKHTTSEISDGALKGFVGDAVSLTRALQPDPHRRLAPPELYPNKLSPGEEHSVPELFDPEVAERSREQRIALCAAIDGAILDGSKGAKSLVTRQSGAMDTTVLRAMVSSNGLSALSRRTLLAAMAKPTFRDGEARRASRMFSARCTFAEDLPDPVAIARGALERVLARLGSVKGPTTRSSMVLAPEAGAPLVKRLLAPAGGMAFEQGRSFWRGIMEQRAFSEHLSIVDNPLLPRGLASGGFDEEGIARRRLTLIEAGVPRNLYLDTYAASKLDRPITTGTPSNRVFGLGSRSLEEIIRDLGEGVYVTGWVGGNSDATTGDFSEGISGHLIRNGEISEPVDGMNITGNLVDLFASLQEVGNDPWPYTSIQTPALVFDGVQFSGSSSND